MPRDTFLPYSPPSIGQEELDEVAATLKSDWITTGPRTRAFEEKFAKYVGAPGDTSLMLNSCTAGLHVALVTLGVGPGDEVIVPTLTFAATANVVEHVGAKPVFVDVLEDTLCIDPVAVKAAITSRTRAVMPVHYAGHPADMDPLLALASEHDLHVIEDAAHAAPTRYKGRLVGSRENFAAFSFYATKNLTTAEGGALTGNPDLLSRARVISLHGMSKDAWKRFDRTGSWDYDIELPGFKYNMTDIQAALGTHQLDKLAYFHARRVEVVKRYKEALAGDDRFILPTESEYAESAWHLFVLRLNLEVLSVTRNEFIDELRRNNIGTSVHYRPLHMMSYYADKYGFAPSDFPVAEKAFQQMVSLPLNPRLTDSDIADVVEAVRLAAVPLKANNNALEASQ